MIRNLDELVEYTHGRGDKLPALRKRIVIDRPGCSTEAVDSLARTVPGMPESYLSIIKDLRLDGIAIGYFQLSPQPYPGRHLIERIISCNDPARNPMAAVHRKYGVYQVASWEADPIAVVHSDGVFKTVQVVKYNTGNPFQRPSVLGNSFEQFLLLNSTAHNRK